MDRDVQEMVLPGAIHPSAVHPEAVHPKEVRRGVNLRAVREEDRVQGAVVDLLPWTGMN
jgi:hypothetical protein